MTQARRETAEARRERGLMDRPEIWTWATAAESPAKHGGVRSTWRMVRGD
jgi:hypothetical protein